MNSVLAVTPVVLATHPVFRWRAPEPVRQYRFRLVDEDGSVVLEETVNGERFELPGTVRMQEGVYYTWEVDTVLADGTRVAGEGDVSLLPAGDRRRLEALRPAADSGASERVLWALLLEREGLVDDAGVEWERLGLNRR